MPKPARDAISSEMSAERWELVKNRFLSAIEQPRDQRSLFIRDACGADAHLRAEVESLLRSHDDVDADLDEPASSMIPSAWGLQPGQQIGPYCIVREIGAGGMGMVYLATRADDEYTKRVAIKMMVMLGDPMRKRFLAERQILARLDHPSIARLLDGGTTEDGVPFIIMEYVEGVPVDEWCRHRDLSSNDRVRLFLPVCAAVQYAHRNLVVHRDLKPANILINAEGEPKLLDFGIAKLLDPASGIELHTATEMRVMTPGYASPEQMQGTPITTASDVYSLGVLLYVLLTGSRPYEVSGGFTPEAVRVVCEQEPARPSTMICATRGDPSRVARELRGDLDRIILKAMEKEPERRYASVEQLAGDLQSFLEGRPVLARRPTLRYRMMKFSRRNRSGVAAAAMVVLTLIAGTVFSLRQTSIAVAERHRAEQQTVLARARFNDVHTLSNSLLFELHDALRPIPGSLTLRQTLTQRGLQYLDRLSQQAGNDPELMSDLAHAYQRLGSVTYGVEATKRSHQRAVGMCETLVREHPGIPRYRDQLAESLSYLADTLKLDGDHQGELAAYERALALTRVLAAANPSHRNYRLQIKSFQDSIGASKTARGNVREGITHGRRALALARTLEAETSHDERARRDVVISLHLLSSSLIVSGAWDEALANYEEALAIILPMVERNPNQNEYRRDLWYVHRNLGTILSLQGKHDGAKLHLETALGLKKALIAADPTDGGHRRGLAITYMYFGDAHRRAGHHRLAKSFYLQAIAIGEPLLLDDPANQETYDDLRDQYSRLSALLATMKLNPEQEQVLRRERALYRQVLTNDPGNLKARHALDARGS